MSREGSSRFRSRSLMWNLGSWFSAFFSMMLFVGISYAHSLDEIVGKWSDSPDEKTCKIRVGATPNEHMMYRITKKYIFFYEMDCLILDVVNRGDGLYLNIDCFKEGSSSRWFQKLEVRVLSTNQLKLRFGLAVGKNAANTSVDQETVYRCPDEKITESPQQENKINQWTHDGSVISVIDNNGNLEIDYLKPRKELMTVGVRTETMLFFGTKDGDKVEGHAYIFNKKCGPLPYEVQGRSLNDGRRIVLSGLSPKVDAKCDEVGQVPDVLIFDIMP